MSEIKSFNVPEGTIINGYEVRRWLGKGWEGEVYKVREDFSDSPRVLKLFEKNDYRSKQIKQICKKFEDLSKIEGIIKYYHAGHWEDKDAYYLVMEYFNGDSLENLCQKPWPVFKALKVVRMLCKIIDKCHDKGECIGDIDPSNILMNTRSEIKIIDIDFGATFNKEHRAQDVIAMSKLLYKLVQDSDDIPNDLRVVLPKKENIIRSRYDNASQVLEALNNLMGE